MADPRREMPNTQTSAPVAPARTTEDVATPRKDSEQERESRLAQQEREVRGDEMPAGAEEPGAGL